jgi:hypothetical protein
MSYGFGFYQYGAWFGFGQVRFRRWGVDICLLKFQPGEGNFPNGYNKYWLTLGLRERSITK